MRAGYGLSIYGQGLAREGQRETGGLSFVDSIVKSAPPPLDPQPELCWHYGHAVVVRNGTKAAAGVLHGIDDRFLRLTSYAWVAPDVLDQDALSAIEGREGTQVLLGRHWFKRYRLPGNPEPVEPRRNHRMTTSYFRGKAEMLWRRWNPQRQRFQAGGSGVLQVYDSDETMLKVCDPERIHYWQMPLHGIVALEMATGGPRRTHDPSRTVLRFPAQLE